jgi:hypothetical protein
LKFQGCGKDCWKALGKALNPLFSNKNDWIVTESQTDYAEFEGNFTDRCFRTRKPNAVCWVGLCREQVGPQLSGGLFGQVAGSVTCDDGNPARGGGRSWVCISNLYQAPTHAAGNSFNFTDHQSRIFSFIA